MKFLILPALVLLVASCNTAPKTAVAENNEPVNIIFLIGDGMGVSQLSSAFYFKEGPVNIARFKEIGLMKTSSATHKITDSAAGATAFACGKKSYNSAIGVDTEGADITNITEHLEGKYTCGLVATSSITHATPAAFYAHADNRHQEELIATQLAKSNISFFAAGGLQFFNGRADDVNYLDSLTSSGFLMDTTLLTGTDYDKTEKYGFLLAPKGMPKMLEGRGDFLPQATQAALDYLSQADNGFFLMVEGSQIDWGGHANDGDYLISEMIDFDNAVGVALDFAEKNGNTLVVVTADHETGGFTLAADHADGMSGDYNTIAPVFSTSGHSGTMVPVLAFGKGAENFKGIFENNEIFTKMLKVAE